MRSATFSFARTAVTAVALAATLSACQDSPAGPQMDRVREDATTELTARVSTAYADQGDIIKVEFTLPVDTRGNSGLIRGTVTWDASRFQYQDGDVGLVDDLAVVYEGDGWLVIDTLTPLGLYEAGLSFHFLALEAGETQGFRMEIVALTNAEAI